MIPRTRFAWLGWLLFASIALTGVSQQLALSPLLGMALSCLPLVYYHLGILARRSTSPLGQSEVDSVYYFGFLVTIASLAFGVYFFKPRDGAASESSVTVLLRQFAAGIGATAYAVFARMHLASRMYTPDSLDSQTVINQQLVQVQEVLQHLTSVSIAAQSLSSNLATARDAVVERSATQVREVLGAIAEDFTRQTREALTVLQQLTATVHQNLSAISVAAGEHDVAGTLKELGAASKALSDHTTSSAAASMEATAALSMLSHELKSFNTVLASGRTQLEAVDGLASSIQTLEAVTTTAGQSMAESVGEVLRVASELRDVGDQIGTAPRTMKRLADQTERTAGGVDFLAGVAGKLDVATEGLIHSVTTMQQLVSSLERVAAVAPAVVDGFDHVGHGASEVFRRLESLAESAEATTTSLKKFKQTSDGIGSSASSLSALAASTQQLATGLAAVSAEIVKSQSTLSTASAKLSETADRANSSMQRELQAATADTALVAQRLILLVNSIVEQTRRQQGARA